MEKETDDITDFFATTQPEATAVWFHKFLDIILEKCRLSELSGSWVCKKCGATVEIDWFEKTLECLACDDT